MSAGTEAVCRRFLVSGRVQGVGFRYAARQAGRDLGLAGFVCNRADGRVECVACGDTDRLARLEQWLRRGPPGAQVTDVVRESVAAQAFEDFAIRY